MAIRSLRDKFRYIIILGNKFRYVIFKINKARKQVDKLNLIYLLLSNDAIVENIYSYYLYVRLYVVFFCKINLNTLYLKCTKFIVGKFK